MTKLPQPDDVERVETGVLQFGEDWPGVFLRGDDALYYATILTSVLPTIAINSVEHVAVHELIRIFSEARIK